ncbi:MAG: hypothetical protein QXT27_05450 [Pyrobaculum sp.]
MNEVIILALAVAAAAAFVALGGPMVVDVAKTAWKLSEYRSLYVLPTVYVANNDRVWLCFNSTAPAAAYNATSGKPLVIHHNCYAGPGHSCTPHKTPVHTRYCKAWIGPLKPGDAVTYTIRGNVAERAITIQIFNIRAR